MFFLFILMFLVLLIIAVHTSRIGVEIENLQIDTERKNKVNEDYNVYVLIYIFKKTKIFKKKTNVNMQGKDIDIGFLKNSPLKVDYKKLVKNIELEVEQIDLNVQVGTEDSAITALLVGTIASILGIIIKKPKYQVIPIYDNKNILKMKLDGIFTIYLMHYIYRQINSKKRREDKNGKSSNRKSYDDCYE